MNLNVVHRLRHGHWYESRFVPISDYLDWRVCGRCQDERAQEIAWRADQHSADLDRISVNLVQIFKPFKDDA